MIALYRSGAVRLALLFVGLFGCALIAAFMLSYLFVSSEIEDQIRADIMAGADALAARLAREPPDLAFSSMSRQRVAALFGPDGRLVYGDPGFSPFIGWRTMPADQVHLEEPEEDRSESVLAYGRHVGTQILVVGEGLDVVEDSREAMIDGFLTSLALIVLFGFPGAAIVAWRFDRRLGRTLDALTAYGRGELARRLPIAGTGDELDRMGLAVNVVLDRMSILMETTRQVTTDVAHDLKTPMTRLRHRLAEAEGASPGEVKEVISAAAAEAEQIIGTFDALLRLSEIEAGARRARFDRVDLSDVLETVADAYGPDAEQTAHRFETKIGPRLEVQGDRELLIQAFANLVENAIRHAGTGATISLAAMPRGSSIEAVVSDTGPGVPEADRARVLRRFGRLEASRSTPGTGLGLTLVNAIADLHNARLELADNCPGLRVLISFPQSAAATTSAGSVPPQANRLRAALQSGS
jgi:signal transduction histidine kinase